MIGFDPRYVSPLRNHTMRRERTQSCWTSRSLTYYISKPPTDASCGVSLFVGTQYYSSPSWFHTDQTRRRQRAATIYFKPQMANLTASRRGIVFTTNRIINFGWQSILVARTASKSHKAITTSFIRSTPPRAALWLMKADPSIGWWMSRSNPLPWFLPRSQIRFGLYALSQARLITCNQPTFFAFNCSLMKQQRRSGELRKPLVSKCLRLWQSVQSLEGWRLAV